MQFFQKKERKIVLFIKKNNNYKINRVFKKNIKKRGKHI